MGSFLESLESEIVTNNSIDNALYAELDVKRGLRNADGSGVLAGLSRISSVIGSKQSENDLEPVHGELRYRGQKVKDLVAELPPKSRFEKSIFLLLVGRLPSEKEEADFHEFLVQNREVPQSIIDATITAIPSPNIMNKLQTVVSALYTLDENPEATDILENVEKSMSLIAKLPMAAAYGYLAQYVDNPQYVKPKPEMSLGEAFLYMLHQGKPPSELEINIVDLCLMLHTEHGGGNNSTFATYVVSSSGSDVYGTVTAAIGSLKGPLHGAANKKVMEMMADIKANISDWSNREEVRDYLAKIVRKEAHDKSGKLYGLGHAVYTLSDPRGVILKEKAREFAESKGRLDEFLLYEAVEEEGPRVFAEVKGSTKVIAPNVDFFSGFVYDCLGIPEEVYTPMFAMARIAGWCAHRIEERLSGKRVIRPAYKFIQSS
tara:strand:- start:124 stop:1419 length:1296 start_codon:yes stop_codon:yes gene_type:complete